jgi:phospholipid N-methyltransferase
MPKVKVNGAPLTSGQERLLYLRKWLRHGRQIASVMPSSRALARATCGRIDPVRVQTIVELGAGTGAVTRAAAGQMHPDSRLIAIERDPDFAKALASAVPAAEVVLDDACNLAGILRDRGVHRVDVVLNVLPIPSPTEEQ